MGWSPPLMVASPLPTTAADLPPSLPPVLCLSVHHSRNPTSRKHCSFVCFDIPQWLHFNRDLSTRNDDPVDFHPWSDRR
ncbi:hypothetical protein HanHA89_Chr03g0103881 [Helianthus annuus]|nr:hypothetical protein HanHA89_Chr03g0103881 [Helianthus annuus]